MADEGTLATTAQVLLAIGEGASAAQILEANTNIWIKMAEADMSTIAHRDIVTNYASIGANYKQFLAAMAANRAAFYAINQDQDSWQIEAAQSKLNVIDNIWNDGVKILENKDKIALMGL